MYIRPSHIVIGAALTYIKFWRIGAINFSLLWLNTKRTIEPGTMLLLAKASQEAVVAADNIFYKDLL